MSQSNTRQSGAGQRGAGQRGLEQRGRGRLVGTLLLWLSGAACLVMVVGFAHSLVRQGYASRKSGWFAEPVSKTPVANDPFADQWTFHAVTYSWSHRRGRVSVARSVYVSYAPTRGELDNWSTWNGWQFHSAPYPAHSLPPRGPSSLYFNSVIDWRALGFGIYGTARQGEESRIVEAPYVALAFVAGLPLLVRWRRSVRGAARRRRGECEWCGHGLAGATRCAECGMDERDQGTRD